jgi:hypothetical protein
VFAELLGLYAKRWEHELFFRELKRQLRKSALLQSHTVTTAAQEIGALMLTAAILAKERDCAADGQVPVLRVSFPKLLELLRPLWLILTLGDDILEEWQRRAHRKNLRQGAHLPDAQATRAFVSSQDSSAGQWLADDSKTSTATNRSPSTLFSHEFANGQDHR